MAVTALGDTVVLVTHGLRHRPFDVARFHAEQCRERRSLLAEALADAGLEPTSSVCSS